MKRPGLRIELPPLSAPSVLLSLTNCEASPLSQERSYSPLPPSLVTANVERSAHTHTLLLNTTFNSSQDDAVSALTGFSLDHVLSDLSIPSTGLSNKLGISGIPTLSSSQIYNEKWHQDDGAVGAGEGEDFEDEVDRELKEEEEEEDPVKMELMSPVAPFKQRRRVRVVRRIVERPKTVYERFPSFEKNKVLDFTELFQGFAVKKSRVVKRPIQCACFFTRSWLANIGL
jgi:hypothetical protein